MSLEALLSLFANPVVQAVLVAVLLLILISLLASFLKRRKRWIVSSYSIEIPDAKETDVEAINDLRLELWSRWSEDRQLDRKEWIGMIRSMVACVAARFHPDAEKPEEKVNLGQLLQHAAGLNQRLSHLLNHPQLGAFRDLTIDDIQSWYKRINKLYNNTFFRTVTNKTLRRIYEFFFLVLSAINPFSIGRRLTSTIGIEIGTRYFFSAFFAILAEESWNMFSDRKADADPLYLQQRLLISLAKSMKTLSGAEYAFLITSVSNSELSDSESFSLLEDLNKGHDKGKALEKLVKKGIEHYPAETVESFARLNSGDELSKLTAVRTTRESWQEENNG